MPIVKEIEHSKQFNNFTQQFTSLIQYKEKKTIIKTMTKARTKRDDYHQLQREEQAILLRLHLATTDSTTTWQPN
jgi:hypothetical protein